MKTLFRSILIFIIFLAIVVTITIIKYPFLSPLYRNKYSAEKYSRLTTSIQNANVAAPAVYGSVMVNNFNSLYPYWLGTRWNFNGISETPGEGSIACGYFVTTVVRDMDFNINRVKLAQCASEEMIIALTDEKRIKRFNGSENELMLTYLEEKKENLFIVGLDNHTGFILHDGKNIYFIHSSGRFPFCVIKEKAEDSKTLLESKYKVLGCISESNKIRKKQNL